VTLHIQFERSGGFGGSAARRTCTFDAADLPAAEAEEIRVLLQTADLDQLAVPASSSQSPRPDEFHYRIVVEREGRRYQFDVSDGKMPASLRPLVKWLTRRASLAGS
jgi:Emfourin